jgi:peptidoglycan hydrolase CwlO-like protein
MITLEQIRLLEGKISRAIELIHALKEENTTLRKGLESAQRRMKELEVMVDGFKTDQKEIESVIVRTLHNLDELEEASTAKRLERPGSPHPAPQAGPAQAPAAAASEPAAVLETTAASTAAAAPSSEPAAPAATAAAAPTVAPVEPRPSKEELDIF